MLCSTWLIAFNDINSFSTFKVPLFGGKRAAAAAASLSQRRLRCTFWASGVSRRTRGRIGNYYCGLFCSGVNIWLHATAAAERTCWVVFCFCVFFFLPKGLRIGPEQLRASAFGKRGPDIVFLMRSRAASPAGSGLRSLSDTSLGRARL